MNHCQRTGEEPEDMIDRNVVSDYGKIARLFEVGGRDAQRMDVLQNNKDCEDRNCSSLADILSLDEKEDKDLSDKNIRHLISKYLEEDLGLNVDKIKGGRRTEIKGELEGKFLEDIANIYSSFVVRDMNREIALKTFLKNTIPMVCR